MQGSFEVDGDWMEAMKLLEIAKPRLPRSEQIVRWLRRTLLDRRRHQSEAISFHYDRPPDFFLPWFERWRSYSQGFYERGDDPPEEAQARKLQFAIDALGLEPGMRVFDMGCGWGSFLEYAGRRGIRVHGITISGQQCRFVRDLIDEHKLPCTVEQVDFLDFQPPGCFQGAVFMGTFEHFPDYRYAARFLKRWLIPRSRIYADFCVTTGSPEIGSFLGKYIWPGATSYVEVPKLIRAFEKENFRVETMRDDTASYALTVRDWADAFERTKSDHEACWGRAATRAFELYLRSSQYYLTIEKTQARHLVFT